MKNHRFPWLRNRTTDNIKCEKARNIKEKRTIEMFSTASRLRDALRSSASADLESESSKNPGISTVSGFFHARKSLMVFHGVPWFSTDFL